MNIRLNLNKFLVQHAVSPYRIVKETTLSPNTIYDLARKPAQRIDLATVGQVITALEKIIGQPVTINDLLETTPNEAFLETTKEPDFALLVANAAKTVKKASMTGKPIGSSGSVRIRGSGSSIVEIIRDGRR